MANITLTVVVENLDSDELDMIADKVNEILTTATQDSKLAGKISECTELDREEDETDDKEVED